MIDKQRVENLVAEWLEGNDYFLTDLSVSLDNRILVEIDQADGVWIDDCVALSKHIENGLDRDAEDFELEVGSAGIGQPFKVLRQYEIHLGEAVEVLPLQGKKIVGTLCEATPENFIIETEEKVKREGEKRPHLEKVKHTFSYDEVRSVKLVITF